MSLWDELGGVTALVFGRISGGDEKELAVDSDGHVQVDVLSTTGTVDVSDRAARDLGKVDIAAFDAALPAGANNIGEVDVSDRAARDLGKVDVAAFDAALPAGTNNIGDVDIASFGAALPAGTNAIGKLAANSGVDIGDVDVASVAAGENHLGQVGGEGITISQTPTVTAGAYAANDAVGGLLTFASAGRATGVGGVIKDVLILDDAGQDVELELWLFDQTFTAMADNAAWAPSEADLRNLVAVISTADGAWFAAGTPSAARVECSQRFDLTGTSLFGQLVTRGTPTFAATDDVTVKVGLLQD